MDAVAELDNAQRAERSRLGKLARVKQGHWLGGPPPFGYSIEKKQLVVNKDEAEWVKRIFTEYANQTPTIDIKVLLDSSGVKPEEVEGLGCWVDSSAASKYSLFGVLGIQRQALRGVR